MTSDGLAAAPVFFEGLPPGAAAIRWDCSMLRSICSISGVTPSGRPEPAMLKLCFFNLNLVNICLSCRDWLDSSSLAEPDSSELAVT